MNPSVVPNFVGEVCESVSVFLQDQRLKEIGMSTPSASPSTQSMGSVNNNHHNTNQGMELFSAPSTNRYYCYNMVTTGRRRLSNVIKVWFNYSIQIYVDSFDYRFFLWFFSLVSVCFVDLKGLLRQSILQGNYPYRELFLKPEVTILALSKFINVNRRTGVSKTASKTRSVDTHKEPVHVLPRKNVTFLVISECWISVYSIALIVPSSHLWVPDGIYNLIVHVTVNRNRATTWGNVASQIQRLFQQYVC